MMVRWSKIFLFMFFSLSTVSGCQAAEEPDHSFSPAISDDGLLVSTLLNISQPVFIKDGVYDGLTAYKAWGDLYERTLNQARTGSVKDDSSLRRFLFLGFIAGARTQAATSEAFTSDLMSLYRQRPEQILIVLRDLPFLVPTTCHYLGAYFGFEDREPEGKPGFLKENRERIQSLLHKSEAAMCLAAIAGKDG
jgi:hypothetical protein